MVQDVFTFLTTCSLSLKLFNLQSSNISSFIVQHFDWNHDSASNHVTNIYVIFETRAGVHYQIIIYNTSTNCERICTWQLIHISVISNLKKRLFVATFEEIGADYIFNKRFNQRGTESRIKNNSLLKFAQELLMRFFKNLFNTF